MQQPMFQINFWEILKVAWAFIWQLWPILLILLVLGILAALVNAYFGKKAYEKYWYERKDSIMTRAESEFFKCLLAVAGTNYHIFPQVHLDAILNFKIKGQSWVGAMHHINQKSVDFVICDLANEKPLVAIELDDRSHEREDRIERDIIVEDILKNAKLPLLRFEYSKAYNLNEISQKVLEALQNQS